MIQYVKCMAELRTESDSPQHAKGVPAVSECEEAYLAPHVHMSVFVWNCK